MSINGTHFDKKKKKIQLISKETMCNMLNHSLIYMSKRSKITLKIIFFSQ